MRIKNLFRNSFFSMLSQFALLILGFFSQRAMNLYMGAELVGMNGVISNVINILSVTELGISTAIVYHLYGALARKDEAEIASLMNLYRKAYHVFAVLVFAAGMAVLPFIHLFMKNNSYSLSYIRVLYAMWLVRTVLSYLLTYRKSLLIADQKEYIASITGLILNVVSYLAIILLVTWEQNYLLALGIGTVTEVVLNIWISWYVEQKYPFLRQRRKEKSTSSLTKRICKRSEKPVYFQNFRKNAVLHGQPDYFRFYRGRYGRTICKLLYDYAGDQQYSHDPCEYDPADGRRLFYRKKSSEKL
ncbi:MAG: lipopolysaccharide biosynthesis protein [Fusicatenibacter saccharivorans]